MISSQVRMLSVRHAYACRRFDIGTWFPRKYACQSFILGIIDNCFSCSLWNLSCWSCCRNTNPDHTFPLSVSSALIAKGSTWRWAGVRCSLRRHRKSIGTPCNDDRNQGSISYTWHRTSGPVHWNHAITWFFLTWSTQHGQSIMIFFKFGTNV